MKGFLVGLEAFYRFVAGGQLGWSVDVTCPVGLPGSGYPCSASLHHQESAIAAAVAPHSAEFPGTHFPKDDFKCLHDLQNCGVLDLADHILQEILYIDS